MQNFKMNASEYLSCAPKYTISRLNNQKKFLGRGPHPTPLGTFGASLLAPSALVPHSKILATPLVAYAQVLNDEYFPSTMTVF